MFQIVPVPVSQAGQLAALQELGFRQADCGVHSAENVDAYCSQHDTFQAATDALSATDTITLAGRKDDKLCGYYIVQHHPPQLDPGLSASELKQVYVLREAYGTGLGRALCEHAFDAIRSVGSKSIWLYVADGNRRAWGFYGKLGFERMGVGPDLHVGTECLSSSILLRPV